MVEVKLSSNSQYLHGYEIQVEEYALAEHALYRIYVMLDLGNPGKVKKLLDKHEICWGAFTHLSHTECCVKLERREK